jgi:aminoglycoside phosphotransferase (APT) family kinase protein
MNDKQSDPSKVVVEVPLVRRLIAAQFPQWAGLEIRPVAWDGWDNWSFHLGDGMKVRLPSAEGYAPQVEKEYYWLPRLAPLLPLPIPAPIAIGEPGFGYPFGWSIYRWLDGETVTATNLRDKREFAEDLGNFLAALQRIDTTDGPPAGAHSFFRGGPLATYDAETRKTLDLLSDKADTAGALAVWNAAMASERHDPPVWVHGDVAVGNLLVQGGRLSAVIDFGCSSVGDPACDLVIAWLFFDGDNRDIFRRTIDADDGTWARARGWAIWKALLVVAHDLRLNPAETPARSVIDAVIAEHRQLG